MITRTCTNAQIQDTLGCALLSISLRKTTVRPACQQLTCWCQYGYKAQSQENTGRTG